jgi:signal transduction histidine kinase
VKDPDRPIEQNLVWLRWALIVSLAYMILIGRAGLVTRPVSLVYVGLLLASNLVIPRIPYRNPKTFGSVLLTLDTIFVLVGVLLSDSSSQDLLIGYFLCVLMATFGDSERRIAGAAFLVVGMYSAWVFRSWDAVNQGALLIRLPFLFITTVFYGYMMQRVRSEHARRMQAEERIHGLDCLLQVTRSFSSSLASQEVLERAARTIQSTLGAEHCTIELVRGDGSQPVSAEAAAALQQRKPIVSSNAEERRPAHWLLTLPILYDIEPLGVLVVGMERSAGGFDPAEIGLCQVIANAAAPALKNARQYESLLEIEKAKSEFLANLSHELRTPLNVIIGFSQLAAEQSRDGANQELCEMIGRISKNASDLNERVESLLQLSQATLGQERREHRRVDLRAMLHRVLEDARRHARPGALGLELDVAPGLTEIYADGEKLERVIENLVSNAVKFTRAGSVRITAALVTGGNANPDTHLPKGLQPWEQLLSLSVRDTGIGIANGDLRKIFQDFRQGNGGLDRQYGGLGIGLSLARRLTEILGGVIRVDSHPDKGSVFEVLVPVQTAGY